MFPVTLLCLLVMVTTIGHAAVPRADRVVVLKGDRSLMLLREGKVLRMYRVALGRQPVGPKTRQGDGKTPEGVYRLEGRNSRSGYYRSIRISYPNPADRAKAAGAGVRPGGNIMIHGLPQGFEDLEELHAGRDWTRGCIAVSNREMDEIWQLVPEGTPIEIRP